MKKEITIDVGGLKAEVWKVLEIEGLSSECFDFEANGNPGNRWLMLNGFIEM